MTPDEALTVLRFVVPGFILLKLLYFLGLRTTRTNFEWVVWSLTASVPIGGAALVLHPEGTWGRDIVAFAVAAIAGVVGGLLWGGIVRRENRLRESLHATAWDAVLSQSHWVEVATIDGVRWMGETAVTAESGATDKVDLYLRNPAQFNPEADEFYDRSDLDGILLAAGRIGSVLVYASKDQMDAAKAEADAAPVGDA